MFAPIFDALRRQVVGKGTWVVRNTFLDFEDGARPKHRIEVNHGGNHPHQHHRPNINQYQPKHFNVIGDSLSVQNQTEHGHIYEASGILQHTLPLPWPGGPGHQIFNVPARFQPHPRTQWDCAVWLSFNVRIRSWQEVEEDDEPCEPFEEDAGWKPNGACDAFFYLTVFDSSFGFITSSSWRSVNC